MEFKVFKSHVTRKDHPNADLLDLVVVGEYQFVAQKGIYQTGDVAIVIPDKSIVPPYIQKDFINYLKGPDKNRVGSVRLRGEFSQGILLNRVEAEKILGKSLDDFEFDVDVSELLGITKYVPYIPPSMAGVQKHFEGHSHYFDAVQYSAFESEFEDDEIVVASEKVHGSQTNYILNFLTNKETVSSKGLLDKGVEIEEDPNNLYWKAARNSKLREAAEFAKINFPEATQIQIVGEVIPCQGGYNYGAAEPRILVFNITLSNPSLTKSFIPLNTKISWPLETVPVLMIGRYGDIKDQLRAMSEGKEQVSGKELHIREGIVVRPEVDRKAANGTWLRLKIINPKYKETGEELS